MTEEIFLPFFEVRILTKTLKAIQMFQLGVGHSQAPSTRIRIFLNPQIFLSGFKKIPVHT